MGARPNTAQALAQRARIVLACAEGQTNTTVARQIWGTRQTWRQRFVTRRLDRVRRRLNCRPIRCFWRRYGIWQGSICSLPDKALVLCVDEKAQIQALDRTRPLLPLRPGQVERRTHDYHRHDTTSLFAALEGKTERVIGQLHQRHWAMEFRLFLDTIEATIPPRLDVHLILDNYGTHTTALIRRWLLKRPWFHLHFTPTGASWLTLAERWFARQLRRGVHPTVRALKEAIRQHITATNQQPRLFKWMKTLDQILASVARFCQRTSETRH